MADTREVEKWTLLHGELVQEDDGPLVWSEDYDTLADKLAEVEANINIKADFIDATINQLAASAQRIEELEADRKKTYEALLKVTRIHDEVEAKLAEVEEDRDDLLIALASARKQLELYIRKGTLDEPLHSHTWNPPTNFGSKEE